MGHTLKNLAFEVINLKSIFNHRFVVELCESVHVHYRQLRITMNINDWVQMAEGMRDALNRWEKTGKVGPEVGKHIELCRKEVAKHHGGSNDIRINFNENLYPKHDGRIFSEGAEFDDPHYIHLKIRDLRLEMSLDEFNRLAKAVSEAKESLCQMAP